MSERFDAVFIFAFTFSAASIPLSNTVSNAVFEVTSLESSDFAFALISLSTIELDKLMNQTVAIIYLIY